MPELIGRALFGLAILVLAIAVVLLVCSLFHVGMADATKRQTPRWTTEDAGMLTLAGAVVVFAAAVWTLRWPIWGRAIASIALLAFAGYCTSLGLFMAFFVG